MLFLFQIYLSLPNLYFLHGIIWNFFFRCALGSFLQPLLLFQFLHLESIFFKPPPQSWLTMLLSIMQLLQTCWIPIILIPMCILVLLLLLRFSMVPITTRGHVLCSLPWKPRKRSSLWMVFCLALLLMILISLYGIIVIPWWFHGFIIRLI